MIAEPVFYQPGKPGIIDLAIARNGVLTAQLSGETLEQVQVRYPGAAIGEFDEVCKASDEMFKHPAVEVTRERWREMLEILPPKNWRRDGGVTQAASTESFMICEHTSGNITSIFARIGKRYFELSDSAFLTHEQIIAAARAALHIDSPQEVR